MLIDDLRKAVKKDKTLLALLAQRCNLSSTETVKAWIRNGKIPAWHEATAAKTLKQKQEQS
jgi:hypothetical protein